MTLDQKADAVETLRFNAMHLVAEDDKDDALHTLEIARQVMLDVADALSALEPATPAPAKPSTYRRGGFETEHGQFWTDEEVIYIDPGGKEWRGIIGEVLHDGEADFVSTEWSRGGTYKWKAFRKLPTPAPGVNATGAEAGEPAAWRYRWREANWLPEVWSDWSVLTTEPKEIKQYAYELQPLYAHPDRAETRRAVIEEAIAAIEQARPAPIHSASVEYVDGVRHGSNRAVAALRSLATTDAGGEKK